MRARLNGKIYKAKFIRLAKKEFAGIADIKIKKDGEYYEVNIDNVRPEYSSAMPGEFYNFLIYLAKNG